jgi:dTDP-4-amino-4,6-dideoxygalactose transaminase
VSNRDFSPWPQFDEEEANAVRDVILSNKVNYWTGSEARKFEKEFADWAGTSYAVALANGTVALDVALKALGIGPGDEVVVTPRTFLASVSCVVNIGAKPVFADVELDTGNISAQTIRPVLTPRTRAIICVHLGGWPCDMDPIIDLARSNNIKVIEDCAQAHGSIYKGRKVGSIGDVGAWSFCQDKIMTTGGEGGMVTTNDRSLWSDMWSYKDHGKSYNAVYNQVHPPGFRWVHESFGTNWRMLETQAAIGRIQLKRMPTWHERRRQNSTKLTTLLHPFSGANGPLRIPRLLTVDENRSYHANYRLYAYVRDENLASGWDRDRILHEAGLRKLPVFQGSCSEVYLEKAFDGTNFRPEIRLPNAQNLGATSLAFLVHPTLTLQEIELIAGHMTEILSKASKANIL